MVGEFKAAFTQGGNRWGARCSRGGCCTGLQSLD